MLSSSQVASGANATARSVALRPSPHGMGMLVGMELRKAVKRTMTWLLFLMLVGLEVATIVVGYLGISASNLDAEARNSALERLFPPDSITTGFSQAGFFGSVGLVVLAASMIGSEFGWGTIRMVVGSGVGRGRLIAAKLVSLGLLTVGWIFVGTVVAVATSIGLALVTGRPVTFGEVDAGWFADVALMAARTWYALMFSLVVAFAVALAFRSLAFGIAASIGLPIVEGMLGLFASRFGDLGNTLMRLTTSQNLRAITQLNSFDPVDSAASGMYDPMVAAVLLLVYSAVLIGIGTILFIRRDLASG